MEREHSTAGEAGSPAIKVAVLLLLHIIQNCIPNGIANI